MAKDKMMRVDFEFYDLVKDFKKNSSFELSDRKITKLIAKSYKKKKKRVLEI